MGNDDNDGYDDNKDGFDNDEQYGYDADIDTQFMPKKKKMFGSDIDDEDDLSDDVQIGQEPAGKNEENVFEIMRNKEIKQKQQKKQDKLKKKVAGPNDFDVNYK